VVRPTGVIERLFGHSCYRLDVSGRIDAGTSWQLGVLAAHALHGAGRLAQEKDAADGVVWATGSVRPVDLTIGGVNHVAEKLASSIDRLKQDAAAGRPVLLAIPDQNAANLTPDMLADLDASGIKSITLTNAQTLWDQLALKVSEPALRRNRLKEAIPSRGRIRKKTLFSVVGAVAALCVVLGLISIPLLRSPVSPQASMSGPAPPHVQRSANALVPELVPFISERDQATIRDVYMSAPDYKALALSSGLMRFVTGQRDKETADSAAVAACQKDTDLSRARQGRARPSLCELYASGNLVVAARGRPPLPQQPWVIRDPSIEVPFAVADIPVIADRGRRIIQRDYAKDPPHKALAISPTGLHSSYAGEATIEQAVRRSLERCGHNAGVACMIIALDEVFVVPIPRSMKVVGFFQPGAINAVAPELREEVVRRFGNASRGWNALAVGAGGRVGIKLRAASEPEAINASLEDCGRQDRDCRVAVIGPFVVESPSVFQDSERLR
jgi:hypothetical protein